MTALQEFLATNGYSTVALPQSGIAPLQLLSEENTHVSVLGAEISSFFKADMAALPSITSGVLPNLQGADLLDIDDNLQIGVFGKILSQLNFGEIKAGFTFSVGNSLKFSFKNVQKKSVALIELDGFLTGAKLIENTFRSYEKRLKNGELCVITEVLQSSNICIETKKQDSKSANAEINLQGAIDVNAGFKTDEDNNSKMTYNSFEPIVFAFKAVRIIYNKPRFWESGEKPRFGLGENKDRVVLKGVEDLNPVWLSPTVLDFNLSID